MALKVVAHKFPSKSDRERHHRREQKKLKQYYKRYKVGLDKWEDIPKHYRKLLIEYYPISTEKVESSQ